MALFKLDENLPGSLRDVLHPAGHEAVTVGDQRLTGAPDLRVAEVCRAEARVLLTLDLDFADIRVYPPGNHAGIIVLRLAEQGRSYAASAVRSILPLLATEPLAGHLWIVDERSVRIRGGPEGAARAD